MAKGNFTIGIELESGFSAKFKSEVLREITLKLSAVLPSALVKIKTMLGNIIRERISMSPEYQAISGGRFRGELGLPDGARRINDIMNIWAEGISVTYIKAKAGGFGMISIGILESDWEDVLSSSQAELTYTSPKGAKTLEWLRWMLKEGGRVIVSQYDFVNSSRGSRTGLGIMVKRRGGWKVPSQFAGTDSDNFATRALAGIEKDIDIVVRRELTRVV
mgnify:CR=1 FL=1|jgi:hypothetical protein